MDPISIVVHFLIQYLVQVAGKLNLLELFRPNTPFDIDVIIFILQDLLNSLGQDESTALLNLIMQQRTGNQIIIQDGAFDQTDLDEQSRRAIFELTDRNLHQRYLLVTPLAQMYSQPDRVTTILLKYRSRDPNLSNLLAYYREILQEAPSDEILEVEMEADDLKTTSKERSPSEFFDEIARLNPQNPQLVNQLRTLHEGYIAKSSEPPQIRHLVRISEACRTVFGFYPRISQVAAVLLFTIRQPEMGRLLQINTGEGKTLIIAMLAALQALSGIQVDVVTSSRNLAIRDSTEKNREFYKALGLVVNHNMDEGSSSSFEKKKGIYATSHVLYGTSSSFCGDKLRSFRSGSDFYQRPSSFLIVDEVDNMLIDCNNYITKLADSGHGLEVFKTVRARIWTVLNTLMFSNGSRPVPNVAEILIEEMIRLRTQFQLSPSQEKIFLLCLDSWVNMAIRAKLSLQEGHDYTVQDNKIVIVDSENTGELQKSMRWSHGLHEYLEMKHHLPLGSDGFTSLYYSNHRFFSDYKSNLCGLTGTIGSEACKNFLSEIYGVDTIVVPTFKPKKYKSLPPILVGYNQWMETLVREARKVSGQDRPALVIVKTIHDATMISESLRSENIKVVDFIFSDEEELHDRVKNISDPLVIVATNLAGRGTDVSISKELNENGGLRVLLGYLPASLRVEQQAFGRTSRAGNPGDGQFIIPNTFCGQLFQDLEQMKILRDLNEQVNLAVDKTRVGEYESRDQMFKEFCSFINSIPNIKQTKGIFEGLCEKWAIFYLGLELEQGNSQDEKQKFAEFMAQLRADFSQNKFSDNPVHLMMRADQLINQQPNAALRLLDQVSKKSGNYGVHIRRAIVCNNNQNYDEAKREANLAVEQFQAEVAQDLASRRIALSTDILSDGVERESRRQGTNIGIALEKEEAPQLNQHFEEDLRVRVAQFENTVGAIMGAIQHNRENRDRIVLDVPESQDFRRGETPEIPPVKPRVIPKKKKRGFLGFILGAVSIVVGGALALFSGGLLASFGVGMVLNGLDLIKTNIEMNANGTYSTSGIIRRTVISNVMSFLTAWGTQALPSLINISPRLAEATKNLSSSFLDSSLLRDITLQTIANRLSNTVLLGSEGAAQVVNEISENIRQAGPGGAGFEAKQALGSKEQQQNFVNDQVKQWYDSEIVPKVEQINPERLKEFLEKLEPAVGKLLDQVKAKLTSLGFNSLHLALFATSKQEYRQKLEELLAQLDYMVGRSLRNYASDTQAAQVLHFTDFPLILNTPLSDQLNSEISKFVDNTRKLLFSFGELFFHFADAKTKIRHPPETFQSVQAMANFVNDPTHKTVMETISEKVIKQLSQDPNWIPAENFFKSYVPDRFHAAIPTLVEFFRGQVSNQDSVLQIARRERTRWDERILNIFETPCQQILLNEIGKRILPQNT